MLSLLKKQCFLWKIKTFLSDPKLLNGSVYSILNQTLMARRYVLHISFKQKGFAMVMEVFGWKNIFHLKKVEKLRVRPSVTSGKTYAEVWSDLTSECFSLVVIVVRGASSSWQEEWCCSLIYPSHETDQRVKVTASPIRGFIASLILRAFVDHAVSPQGPFSSFQSYYIFLFFIGFKIEV